jgi:hypothetical protein
MGHEQKVACSDTGRSEVYLTQHEEGIDMRPLGVFAALALALVAFSPLSHAVVISSWEKIPATYARQVTQPDGSKTVVFTQGGISHDPKLFDQILQGYGVSLKDAAKVPPSYAREVTQPDGKKVIVFGPGSIYEPKVLDGILQGYGVSIKDPSKLPASYAREVTQPDGKKVIVFSTGAITYEPKVFDQILQAYGQ